MTLIETDELTKHFSTDSGVLTRLLSDEAVHAVDDVSIDIERGQTLGLVGESGCGKSTLGRTLLRLHEPTSGDVYFDGDNITDLSQRALRPYRRKMQMVFQDPQASLNPRQTVGELLRKPIEFHGIAEGEEAEARTAELVESVGLNRNHLNRYPHEFSGGQQQRIGLARALSVNPEFIVLDEPVSALDVSVQAKILDLIESLRQEYDLTLLFIAHDLNVVRHVCDEVAVMYLGEVIERAPVDELFADPRHPYTKGLLESILLPDSAASEDLSKLPITGDVPSPIDPPSGCRFRTRCPEATTECEQVDPELRSRKGERGERTVACHLYD
jgi:oligopeptide/dipeptide ABC transporter ATP-binding protein